MEGEEVGLQTVFLDFIQMSVYNLLMTASRQSGTADLEMREFFLEVFEGDREEFRKLVGSTLPAGVGAVCVVAIGLVPDLPIFDAVVEAVSPALVVVTYDMFADACPFEVILGRIGAVLVAVLDRGTEAVEGLCSHLDHIQYGSVGRTENVGRGIVLVGIEILEDSVYVNGVLAAVARVEGGVVVSRIGYLCRGVGGEAGDSADSRARRAVVDGVHRLYVAAYIAEINRKCFHMLNLSVRVSCFLFVFELSLGDLDMLRRLVMNVHPIGVDTLPSGLHHTHKSFGGDVLCAVICEKLEVVFSRPYASRGDLIVAVLVEHLEGIHADSIFFVKALVCGGESPRIVPVALDNVFRHLFEEKLGVVPGVVRPDPGASSALFYAVKEEIEVVPPKVAVSYDGILESLLIAVVLLVHTEMEIFRLEELADLCDKVLADLIIYGGGEHTGIVLQPDVVASREVELGNELEAHALQLVYLCQHLIVIPRALNSDLGMGLVAHSLANVDDKSIDACVLKLLHMSIPAFTVKEENGGGTGSGAMLSACGVALLVPHIGAEMDEISPHKILVFSHDLIPVLC